MFEELKNLFPQLRATQQVRILQLARTLVNGASFYTNRSSDFATREFNENFGDLLLEHNLSSTSPLTKDKFEYALVSALNQSGFDATKLPNGNPGEDIIVNGEPWSLKTQADRSINHDFLHISKFMELGKGAWLTESDIRSLQDRMFQHMTHYKRILSLRCFKSDLNPGTHYEYELVEIPISLLMSSAQQPIEIQTKSRQTPKPAYIRVYDSKDNLNFRLYFDGGTERKLQVQRIRKDLCTVHTTWTFTV